MTCKDCKRRFECSYSEKSYRKSKDGDAWANWCEAFQTKHKSKWVEKDGFTAYQSGYNWHISITDNMRDQMVLHASCTKRVSKRALKKMIDQYSSEEFERAFREIFHDESEV